MSYCVCVSHEERHCYAKIAVADWRQRQSMHDHLHTDAGEAGVWLRRTEL